MSDLTATNRNHFNNVASTHHTDFGPLIETIMQRLRIDIAGSADGYHCHQHQALSKSIREKTKLNLSDSSTATKALLPFITQAIGLDLSENMVAEYNAFARANGYPPTKMRAYHLDLLDSSIGGDGKIENELQLELSGFDVVVICMALHHVADAERLLRRLKACLKAGGVCVVIDGVPTPAPTATEQTDTEADTADLRAVLQPEQLGVLATINKHGYTEGKCGRCMSGLDWGGTLSMWLLGRRCGLPCLGIGLVGRGLLHAGRGLIRMA